MATQKKSSTRGVVILTVLIVALFSGLFLLEFIRVSSQAAPTEETVITSDTYTAEVSALLENADAIRGEAVITQYECHTCHIQGAGQIAPAFTGLNESAVTRRPPLTAAAYLYEAIVNPSIHLVERESGETYPPAMPTNYPERLTDQELGDVIAYLLTQ